MRQCTTSHLRQQKQLRQLEKLGFTRDQCTSALDMAAGAPVVLDVFPGVRLFVGSSLPRIEATYREQMCLSASWTNSSAGVE